MSTKLRKELSQALHDEVYDVTEDGIYFPKQGVQASGEYFDRINGGDWQRTPNLIVEEGLAHILNVALGPKAKPPGYYLPCSAAAPARKPTGRQPASRPMLRKS